MSIKSLQNTTTYCWLALPEAGCWVTVQGCVCWLCGDLNNGLAAQFQWCKCALEVSYTCDALYESTSLPFLYCFIGVEAADVILQAKDIESYSSDPEILALAEQFCTSCSVSVSNCLRSASSNITHCVPKKGSHQTLGSNFVKSAWADSISKTLKW